MKYYWNLWRFCFHYCFRPGDWTPFELLIQFRISKHWLFSFSCDVFASKDIGFRFNCKKTAPLNIEIELLIIRIFFKIENQQSGGYDLHLDKYMPEELCSTEETYCCKDIFSSKRLRVYANNVANTPNAKAVEIALPKLCYFKMSYKKPWEYGFWLGIDIWFQHYRKSAGIKVSLFRRDFKILIGKNSFGRRSNLANEKAVDRYILLNEGYRIADDDLCAAFHTIGLLFEENGLTVARNLIDRGLSPYPYLTINPCAFEECSKELREYYFSYLERHPADNIFWKSVRNSRRQLLGRTVKRLEKIKGEKL